MSTQAPTPPGYFAVANAAIFPAGMSQFDIWKVVCSKLCDLSQTALGHPNHRLRAKNICEIVIKALEYKRDLLGIDISIYSIIKYLPLDQIEALYLEGLLDANKNVGVWNYGYQGIRRYLARLPSYSEDELLIRLGVTQPKNKGNGPNSRLEIPLTLHAHAINLLMPALIRLANEAAQDPAALFPQQVQKLTLESEPVGQIMKQANALAESRAVVGGDFDYGNAGLEATEAERQLETFVHLLAHGTAVA